MGNRTDATSITFNRATLVTILLRAKLPQEEVNEIIGHGTEEHDSYASYWETVDALAEEVRVSVADGTDEGDAIWEACDGNYWTIYTHAAMRALEYSSNEWAGPDDLGELPKADSYGDLVSGLAFYALRADVTERYQRMVSEAEENETDDDE